MKRIALHWQIFAALLLATLAATAFRGIFPEGEQPEFIRGAIELCKLVGDLFLRALKMIIVPLIVTSVVGGIAVLLPHGVMSVRRARAALSASRAA